jgi:hypothetical protein
MKPNDSDILFDFERSDDIRKIAQPASLLYDGLVVGIRLHWTAIGASCYSLNRTPGPLVLLRSINSTPATCFATTRPVSGAGLTGRRQELLFSCLAPLHRRGM